MIFIHISKTGGQSFLRSTQTRGNCHDCLRFVEGGDHITTIIRNPYDRAVSTYYYLMQIHVNAPNWGKGYKYSPADFAGINEWWKHVHEYGSEYIQSPNLSIRGQHRLAAYYRKQIDFLNDADGEPISERINTVLRYETLAEDWPAFAEKHGFGELQHANKSKLRPAIPWQDELSDESIAKIGELYADDFEQLNYERIL